MLKNTPLLIAFFVLTLLVSACSPKAAEMPTAILPAGLGYAEGKEIYFVHTETSDAEIAKLLSDMMSSPVLFTPGLADTPEQALANVYVFENGVEGMGPLGFQPDIFDAPPGSAEYSPLRVITLVKWIDPSKSRLLKSTAEIISAQTAGEIELSDSDIVVNMPFVVWDGGKR